MTPKKIKKYPLAGASVPLVTSTKNLNNIHLKKNNIQF